MGIKNEKGMATIEATLILPVFMAFMLVFISYANLAIIEMRMQYAVNQTAKEVSEYYYIAYKFGLNYSGVSGNDDVDSMLSALESLRDEGSEAYSALDVDDLSAALSGLSSGEGIDMSAAQSFVNTIKNSFTTDDGSTNAIDIIKSIIAAFNNVKTTAGNITSDDLKQLGGNTVGAILTVVIADPIARAIFPKYLTSNSDIDTLLKSWGIEEGLDGVEFGASSFLFDGQTIQVVATYEIELFSLGIFDFDMTMCQVGSTRAWIGDAVDITEKKSES